MTYLQLIRAITPPRNFIVMGSKIAHNTPKAFVLVSHWHADSITGARKGLYAGQVYEVVRQFVSHGGTDYTEYKLTDTLNHTIRTEYTKEVA